MAPSWQCETAGEVGSEAPAMCLQCEKDVPPPGKESDVEDSGLSAHPFLALSVAEDLVIGGRPQTSIVKNPGRTVALPWTVGEWLLLILNVGLALSAATAVLCLCLYPFVSPGTSCFLCIPMNPPSPSASPVFPSHLQQQGWNLRSVEGGRHSFTGKPMGIQVGGASADDTSTGVGFTEEGPLLWEDSKEGVAYPVHAGAKEESVESFVPTESVLVTASETVLSLPDTVEDDQASNSGWAKNVRIRKVIATSRLLHS